MGRHAELVLLGMSHLFWTLVFFFFPFWIFFAFLALKHFWFVREWVLGVGVFGSGQVSAASLPFVHKYEAHGEEIEQVKERWIQLRWLATNCICLEYIMKWTFEPFANSSKPEKSRDGSFLKPDVQRNLHRVIFCTLAWKMRSNWTDFCSLPTIKRESGGKKPRYFIFFLVRCYEAIINRVCAWNKLKQPQFIIKRQSSGPCRTTSSRWSKKSQLWETSWSQSSFLMEPHNQHDDNLLCFLELKAEMERLFFHSWNGFILFLPCCLDCNLYFPNNVISWDNEKKLISWTFKRTRTIRNEESENF